MTPIVTLPLGLGAVTPMTAPEVAARIKGRVGIGAPTIVGNLNLHGLYLFQVDASFREFCGRADVLLIDGWPVRVLASLGSGRWLPSRFRVGSTDWLELILDADPEIDVVAVGGTPETATGASEHVSHVSPRIRWHAFDGYDGRRAPALAPALGGGDLVLVGLGMPRQERWILDNLEALAPGAVVANVGGCLDYLAGVQRLAPRWLGGLGLEWLYRLVADPRRLWKRYLLEPWALAGATARNRIRLRRGRSPLWQREVGVSDA